jgi:ribonuclease R
MQKLRQQILECYESEDFGSLPPRLLARMIRLQRTHLEEFNAILKDLIKEGILEKTTDGELAWANPPHSLRGTLKKTPRGMGYVLPEGARRDDFSKEIVVPPEDMLDAQTGDEVQVVVSQRRQIHGRPKGRIVRIITRSRTRFVGTLIEKRHRWYVMLDGQQFPEPFEVEDATAKSAHQGDKVLVEMLTFPSLDHPGEIVITKILGAHGDPGVDTQSVIHEFGLREEFPEAVLEQAREQARQFETADHSHRLDLTATTIVTIDPATARDFDDAISLFKNEKGHWELGVHIADVAHFAPVGSPLDQEARQRGTSVYLPNLVIPMFPELLSNGLASLQEGKLRYTKTAFIEYDPEGRVVKTSFANSMIRVTRRFAYEQVLEFLERPEQMENPPTPEIAQLLHNMHDLAMLLRKRRFKQGSLELSLPEIQLELNDENQVSGASVRAHDVSHQMIEEFMLAANVAVAQELNDKDIRFLRRVHAQPDITKLMVYAEFVRSLGFELTQPQDKHALQKLLDDATGTAMARPVHYGLLRSLKQAEYSPVVDGHYALAMEQYCHFTSPIRRYPDLTIHRLIGALVDGVKPSKLSDSQEALVKLGDHCSKTERTAERAERELKKIKLLTMMSEKVGETFSAYITGVERFGIFCELQPIPVEGLIPLDKMPYSHSWDHYPEHHKMVSRRTGQTLQLGETIEVKIKEVDLSKRLMELAIMSVLTEPLPPGARREIPTIKVNPLEGNPRRRREGQREGRSEKSSSLPENHPYHRSGQQPNRKKRREGDANFMHSDKTDAKKKKDKKKGKKKKKK